MFKPALGAIAGHLAMFAVVFTGLTGLYVALGTERAFAPGSFGPSPLWIAIMFAVSLVAAVLGGAVATRIGGRGGLRGLIGLVLVLGGLSIVLETQKPAPEGPRDPDLPAMEAMQEARSPLWVTIAMPILGVFGALYGSKRGLRN